MPDVERMVVLYLRASSDVQALISQRVATELPASPTWPMATVTLISGEERLRLQLDAQRIQVDAWGGTKAQANLLIRTLRAVLLQMPSVTHDAGIVSMVHTLVGPQWLPDDTVNPARPRYLADFEIVVHPLPS
jgi:hypothetical protein